MKLDLKELLNKLTNTHKDGIKTQDFTLTSRNATYYQDDLDATLSGYTPISVSWNSNQITTTVYDLRILSSSHILIGRYNAGASLSSNYLYVHVTYLKNDLIGK